jgi:hypothetical protein
MDILLYSNNTYNKYLKVRFNKAVYGNSMAIICE